MEFPRREPSESRSALSGRRVALFYASAFPAGFVAIAALHLADVSGWFLRLTIALAIAVPAAVAMGWRRLAVEQYRRTADRREGAVAASSTRSRSDPHPSPPRTIRTRRRLDWRLPSAAVAVVALVALAVGESDTFSVGVRVVGVVLVTLLLLRGARSR
jgi:hypothetical protein